MILLTACDLDESIYPDTSNDPWQGSATKLVLTEMSGNFPNSTVNSENMLWQESYILNPDGRFLKTRERDSVVTHSNGTYEYSEISGERFIVFSHETESVIIGNCTGNKKEHLAVRSNNTFFNTWLACDGPSLLYRREF